MHDFSATLILHKRALISNEHSISLLLGITSCSFAGRIARRSDQHSKNSVKFFIKFCTPKRWEIWAFFIRAVAIFSWYYLVFGGVLPQIAFKPFIITFFLILEDLHQRWVFWRTWPGNCRGPFVRNGIQNYSQCQMTKANTQINENQLLVYKPQVW